MRRIAAMFAVTLFVALYPYAAYPCGGPGKQPECVQYHDEYYYTPSPVFDFLTPLSSGSTNLSLLVKKYNPDFYEKYGSQEVGGWHYSGYEEWNDYVASLQKIFDEAGHKLPDLERRDIHIYGANQCRSNNFETIVDFMTHVHENTVAAKHMGEILVARHGIIALCGGYGMSGSTTTGILDGIKRLSAHAEVSDYRRYLLGAYYFYSSDLGASLKEFTSLSHEATDAWLKETATYMVARIQMIISQDRWSGYGKPYGNLVPATPIGQMKIAKKTNADVDIESLNKARLSFANYLGKYPDGIYANSAKNLKRRIAFLGGNYEELDSLILKNFEETLKSGMTDNSFDAFIGEVTSYYGKYTDQNHFPAYSPFVAAMLTFRSGYKLPDDILEVLAKNKGKYQKYPGLYLLVRDQVLYRKGQYGEIVKNYKKDLYGAGPVKTDLQVIIARSLESLGKFAEARGLWREVASTGDARAANYAKVAAIDNYLADGDLKGFLKTYPYSEGFMYRNILAAVTSDEELARLAEDKELGQDIMGMARSLLLKRYLVTKRYGEFIKSYEALGKPSEFEGVLTAVTTLHKNPDDPNGLLNAGYFIQYYKIDNDVYHACVSLPGVTRARNRKETDLIKIDSPLSYYMRAINTFKANSYDPLEAKILYHAIKCFEQNPNGRWWCVGEDVRDEATEEVRKAWFDRLKTKYRDTVWAKKLKYYW